jgi:hypothetical protein
MIDVEQVFKASFARRTRAWEKEADDLNIVAAALTPDAPAGDREQGAAVLESDSDLRSAVFVLAGIAGIPPARLIKSSRRTRARMITLASLAALVLISTTAVFEVLRPDRGEMLLPKGSSDSLRVAVERGNLRFRVQPMDRLEDGDRVGLFYSATRGGYLLVMTRDQDKHVATLSPARAGESAPIRPGVDVALPDGAVVGRGESCEWIVAVFSDAPLKESEVRAQIAGAEYVRETCELRLKIPEARMVRIVPVRR